MSGSGCFTPLKHKNYNIIVIEKYNVSKTIKNKDKNSCLIAIHSATVIYITVNETKV
jgi:hypothetical protein